MRTLKIAISLWLFTIATFQSRANFSSLYVFGDALSATADPSAPGAPYYYGQRWSNGRVWVEVLAQRQGLTFDASENDSYYDHNSLQTVIDVTNFTPPSDVATALFVVWVCNADTFDASTTAINQPGYQFGEFINANIQSQANYLQIISALYAKGVRNLIVPNVVDISEIPAFNAGTAVGILHAGCVDYNARFSNTISQARALCPGLTIYTPDFFTLLNNVLANASYYGLTNALSSRGYSIDAYDDPSIVNLTLDGQGTNYIFWDPQNPTAQFHAVIADVVQQIISPVQINHLAVSAASNRLDVANVPVGLSGFVEGTTNLAQTSWSPVTNFNSTATFQSIFVPAPQLPLAYPASGTGGNGSTDPNNTNNVGTTYNAPFSPAQFYQLYFPYAWSWP
jgi:phospholipase/lecithinase/hemolysin